MILKIRSLIKSGGGTGPGNPRQPSIQFEKVPNPVKPVLCEMREHKDKPVSNASFCSLQKGAFIVYREYRKEVQQLR